MPEKNKEAASTQQGTDGGYSTAHARNRNIEIPPHEWLKFFDAFSRQHEGWLASIEVTGGKEKSNEVRDWRLDGVSSDHLNPRGRIYVAVVRDKTEHLIHSIPSPQRVIFKRNADGAHEGMEVHSGDGSVTNVRFRVATSPEMLDGVLSEFFNPREQPNSGQQRNNPTDQPFTRDPTSGGGKIGRQAAQARTEQVARIPVDRVMLEGNLVLPENSRGVVLFAHGSGSSRSSPRNRYVAQVLHNARFGTLLMDLLTSTEEALDEHTAALRFDIELLARRVIGATWWLKDQSQTAELPIGYFGASTGAAAALVAAAELSDLVGAVVSRGGRPDLAGTALQRVISPTLLIVGGNDPEVLRLNQMALALLSGPKKLEVVPGATHLFEEPGALERVAELARDWFATYLAGETGETRAA